MSQEKPKELTKDFTDSLFKFPNQKKSGYVQILEYRDEMVKHKMQKKVVLSDGYFSTSCIVMPNLAKRFLSETELKMVIWVKALYYDNIPDVFLMKFKVIYDQINVVIGKPIEVSK